MAAALAIQKPPQGNFSGRRRASRKIRHASHYRLKRNWSYRLRRTSGAPVFGNGAVTGAFGYLLNDMLHYDGKKLSWLDDNGNVVSEYGAVSGREGYQSAEFQSEIGKGPIPEGLYLVGQDQLQSFNDLSVAEQVAAHWPFGKITAWPGGQISWGEQRVWLSPANGDFFGRSGFSIHGGWYPGSAGCIDLTGQMGSFASQFRNYGNDMWLRVNY